MAYKRRTYRRRRYRRRMGGRRSLAARAMRTARYVKQLVGKPEVKKVDTTSSLQPYSATPTLSHLSAVEQGNSSVQRIGNAIKPKYLKIAANMRMDVANASQTFLRILIFIDKRSNNVAPTGAEVLQVVDTVSPYNRDNVGRFFIMRDRVFTFSVVGRTAAQYKTTIRFRKTQIRYDGAASTDYYSSPIWMLCISNEPNYPPTITLYTRLGFTDD